jgi:hypothetical protein
LLCVEFEDINLSVMAISYMMKMFTRVFPTMALLLAVQLNLGAEVVPARGVEVSAKQISGTGLI